MCDDDANALCPPVDTSAGCLTLVDGQVRCSSDSCRRIPTPCRSVACDVPAGMSLTELEVFLTPLVT